VNNNVVNFMSVIEQQHYFWSS